MFVTYDGMETDLDLGHYERFIDEDLNKYSNLTTGKVYWNVLNKETLKAEFDRRMRKYNLSLDVSFEQTLNRLKTRELIVCKMEL